MIRIHKPIYLNEEKYIKLGHKYRYIPKWKVFEINIVRDYNSNPDPFHTGKYNFKSGYGEGVYRNAFLLCQGNKCCYCEKPISNGAIEHYRPKASCQDHKNGPVIRPGYYFLAYRWSNMLLSCTECNSSGQKGILFPINGIRATNIRELAFEDPVIINPSSDEPEIHITFNEDIPTHLTNRGAENINIFKLKSRGDITTIRRDRFILYKRQKEAISLGLISGQDLIEAKRTIKCAQKFSSPFAGMIRANIKKGLL